MLAQTAHANNLANVNTAGFKADFATARSMPVYFGEGLPSRAFTMVERPATDMAHGALQHTGRDLDLAIEGDGYFTVQAGDGSEDYTRAGNLHVDALGAAQCPGLAVLAIPVVVPANSVEIGSDGSYGDCCWSGCRTGSC